METSEGTLIIGKLVTIGAMSLVISTLSSCAKDIAHKLVYSFWVLVSQNIVKTLGKRFLLTVANIKSSPEARIESRQHPIAIAMASVCLSTRAGVC